MRTSALHPECCSSAETGDAAFGENVKGLAQRAPLIFFTNQALLDS